MKIKETQKAIDRICITHPQEQLTSVCTSGRCDLKGPICIQCLVREHTDHLDKTWNLNNFIKQIQNSLKELQPGSLEMNQFLIEFKVSIRESKNKLVAMIDKIDSQVNHMLRKVKGNLDQDIDEIKMILNKLGKSNRSDDFIEKVQRLTQYFGIDPKTHKVYRKNAYQELYKSKTNDLLYEQKDYFDKQSRKLLRLLGKIEKQYSSFHIPQIEIVEVPKFQATSLICSQKIEMAHYNWVRSLTVFRLSEKEVSGMNLQHLSQMAGNDPYSKDDLMAIVTTSDDMDIKIWNYSPDDKKFHILQQLVGAHSREFFGLRVHYCDSRVLSRMGSDIMCNNLLFTSEHGLIKVWDWVSKKCVNEIKTQSFFTYDFEILRFRELGICFASGSKNIIQVADFTSPAGMLIINEINPEEQNKDISVLKKIPQKSSDLLVVAFASIQGVIKIFNYEGKCITKVHRQDHELPFCIELVKIIKRAQSENTLDVLIVGSDAGIVSAFDITTGQPVWVNDKLHTSWVRGLCSFVVKDSFYFKTIILSQAENDSTIKMLDASNGELLHSINTALDSGVRFRSMAAMQGALEPKLPDSSIVVAGTSKGTLVIFKVIDQNN